MFSQDPNWQQYSIVSDNGLAPNRRQAIIWTNAARVGYLIHIFISLERASELVHG